MSDTETELAAALAGVDAFLRAEAGESDDSAPASEPTAWRDNARLAGCGIPAPRGSRTGWNVAERLRRGAGGFYGVTGL